MPTRWLDSRLRRSSVLAVLGSKEKIVTHIFALQGPSNCGKTDTLIRVRDALVSKYPSATIQNLHGGTRDIKVILRGIKGLVVGIESQGDPNSRLQQSLNDFISADCDIIFCACRTKGMTVAWINTLSPPHHIRFISQSIATHIHTTTNTATAATLIHVAGL